MGTNDFYNIIELIIRDILGSESEYLKLLKVVGNNQRCDFLSQLSIYSKNTDARACTSFDMWRERFNRTVALEGRTTFYYQVISILNNRINKPYFIFASPNIPNPEVFLETLTEGVENAATLHTDYAPVTQFKFIIDFETGNISYYNHQQEKQEPIVCVPKSQLTLNSAIRALVTDPQTGLRRQTLAITTASKNSRSSKILCRAS